MYILPCKCGNMKKSFKFDIGDSFYGPCCADNGFEKGASPKELDLEDICLSEGLLGRLAEVQDPDRFADVKPPKKPKGKGKKK